MKSNKYMFVSDLHGNIENFEKCIEIFEKEKVLLKDFSGEVLKEINF